VKVAGEKVKLAGAAPSVGLYFVNTADGTETKAAATSIAENTKGHILAVIPLNFPRKVISGAPLTAAG